MDRNTAAVGWSDDQWSRVLGTVQSEAQKASVSSRFLSSTLFPDRTALAVPDNTLGVNLAAPQPPVQRLVVNRAPTTFFASLAINVALTSQEVADDDLQSAMIQFRRAVHVIKRVEDALIFRGQPAAGVVPPGVAALPPVFTVGLGGAQPGLYGAAPYLPRLDLVPAGGAPLPPQNLAGAIIDAVGILEGAGQNGPFACILDHEYFRILHTPTSNLVLAADTVSPYLEGGTLLRTSTLPQFTGLLIALGVSPPEVVISSELHVRFLQITTEPRYVFRISERVALRVPDWTSILVLHA